MKFSRHIPYDMVNLRRFLARNIACVLSVWLGFAALTAPAQAASDAPLVFAAASLRGALDEAAEAYGGAVLSYGGSGTMARQVAGGAPADLVILASEDWMTWLVAQGGAARAEALLSNSLVLIGAADAEPLATPTAASLLARLSGGRLAMGQTQSVPAGIYGRAWLEQAGLWAALSPHLAETENVRVALALVARGEAPLGLVYATDAQADPGVRTVYEVPRDAHPVILYPAAALTDDGEKFLDFLEGSEAQLIFARYGFLPAPEGP